MGIPGCIRHPTESVSIHRNSIRLDPYIIIDSLTKAMSIAQFPPPPPARYDEVAATEMAMHTSIAYTEGGHPHRAPPKTAGPICKTRTTGCDDKGKGTGGGRPVVRDKEPRERDEKDNQR